MRYDIYFHNDFDGRASAAILLYFLRKKGDEAGEYFPIGFDIKSRWPTLRFPNPAIIVDFLYHPKAAWWFDHHLTSFMKEEWRKKFRPTKFRRWDPRYLSCCHLVLDSLVEEFGFKPPRHLRELAKWLDVVDAARYASPKQTLELKEPALRIDSFIDSRSKPREPLAWLIELLSSRSLAAVAKDQRIKNVLSEIKRKRRLSLLFYKQNILLIGVVTSIDISGANVEDLRYASYYFYPAARYNVILKRGTRGFHLTVGGNPWQRKKLKVNIGIMLKKYGGGGHRYVGGVEMKKKAEVEKAVAEIIKRLNQ